jgi:hypothetical protein
METFKRLGTMRIPNWLKQYARKLPETTNFPSDFDGEVETRFVCSDGAAYRAPRKVEFVYSKSCPKHTDYEAISHLLILQSDNHRLIIDFDYMEELKVNTGEIIALNIDEPHELVYRGSRGIPFVALAYDVCWDSIYKHNHKPLKSVESVPFFNALIHNMEGLYRG